MLSVSAPREGAFAGIDLDRLRLLAPHAARAFEFGTFLGEAHLVRYGVERGGALLLVQDLSAPPSRSVVPQLRHLGLTSGEARTAMRVGRGGTPREAAEAVGVSLDTARSQIKAAYAKLGLRRQSELAVRVIRLDGLADG